MTIINGIEIDNTKYNENEIKKAILNNNKAEDKLHVIAVISNPCNYAIRYILTKEFIRRMKDEEHVELYVIELAYGDQEYYITDINNKNHLRLRTDENPMWHKENLVNIGIKKLLPNSWKAVAWIDCDLEFENPNWASDTLKILNGCKDIVQLFSHVLFSDVNGDTELILTGMGFQHTKKMKRSTKIKEINSYWHPGFAWACTRQLYEKMGGLYEYAITGDGDMLMASCFLSCYQSALPCDVSDDYKKTLEEFEKKVLNCRMGYVPGVIKHHYHGSINSRKYDMREQILIKYNYSPTIYLTKNNDGLLVPTNLFPDGLKKCIIEHFRSKNEDSTLQKNTFNHECQSLNLVNMLETKLQKSLSTNCILINLKKDTMRLSSSITELEKVCITQGTLAILEAVYWKNTLNFEKDLNIIFNFLKEFNNDIPNVTLKINLFSEVNDLNIILQGAPLACYCSHVKALMHGYYNFDEYTIIAEDDIVISNSNKLQEYIYKVPDDWDIICFNAEPTASRPIDKVYKLKSSFYHLHFYIVRNRCLETIFKNLYPINDQIDVIIGNLYNKLNIYNIVGIVDQKNYVTNVQNNLNMIYNNEVYSDLIIRLKKIEELCIIKLNNKFEKSDALINKNISQKIIEDVIYTNVFNNLEKRFEFTDEINQSGEITELNENLQIILKYFVKDNQTYKFASSLINDIDYIIDSFDRHYTVYNDVLFKAYSFGSTSSVYISEDHKLIMKVYNNQLRWKTKNHDNIQEIFQKEVSTIKKIYPIISDFNNLIIVMDYFGESLYQKFVLPLNWKQQISDIFQKMTHNNIRYQEFNLNNITVKDDIIHFVDFGLTETLSEVDNTDNCKNFIELLSIINDKFTNVTDINQQHILYNTFMNNARLNKLYINNIF